MSSKPLFCPQCEAETSGQFCDQCGEKVSLKCATCETEASTGARFCSQCGSSLPGGVQSSVTLPWIAVGAVGVTLGVIGVLMILERDEIVSASVTSTPSTTNETNNGVRTPDEVAEQLFNHVMMANERGDTEESLRFAPLALNAYGQLGTLDDDARYHVGLIHVTMGNTESAQRELGTIRRSVPNHLLGSMLEHAIAEAQGDNDGIVAAYTRFVAAYNTELLSDRDEYRGHRRGIDEFRARADRAVRNR